ncbi:MAG: PEP-CTERM sorting domain-containing protein [Phycisphaerae bacterium]|nr:PEP-CTERM sorting domain-containing protein [Phycisphaerae bacterium]
MKMSSACGLLAAAMVAASAQAASIADIVFVVDESGSMAGEHAWIASMIASLDAGLAAKGVQAQYGLVGFGGGGAGNAGRQINVGGGQFGTAAQFAAAAGSLVTTGATEDGYAGVNFALGYTFRPGAAQNFILITDEDRDVVNGAVTFASLSAALNARNALLNVVVDAALNNGANTNPALGINGKTVGTPPINPNAINYRADGSGGFIKSPGARVSSAFGTTEADYINMAFGVGFVGPMGPVNGAAWDLNQLRLGGNTALSFTKAFVDLKVQEIVQQTIPLPTGAWMGLIGLVGVGVVRRIRR